MSNNGLITYASAIQDFRRARQQAVLKEAMARLTGGQVRLLSYDEVRQQLKAQNGSERGLRDIPLDAIVGSVGRTTDFTRDFLPRASVTADRWARVEVAVGEPQGLSPIDVYQLGEVYFVKDGNHRVSVARQMGAKYIQANVTEVRTRVPLTPDMRPDEIILSAEYAHFLERTHLDTLRPEADLSVSTPGQYPILEEHISVHRWYMGIDFDREVSEVEAVAHWYDTIYLPVVDVIRRQGILRDFPGRTEADLYLWLAEHRATLKEELGLDVPTEAAAGDLAEQKSPRAGRVAARVGEKLLTTLLPDSLEPSPPTGEWRRRKESAAALPNLFEDILVPVNGREDGWRALDEAFVVARREKAHIHGLHVIPADTQRDNLEVQAVQEEFSRRCEAAGFAGQLSYAEGDVARRISEWARWVDLVIVTLLYPPATGPIAAMTSGFRQLIQRCPRPILAVPGISGPVPDIHRALLAYDGSPKAREALFIATYLAGFWKIPLAVLTVFENGNVASETLLEAQVYLENHGVESEQVKATGPAPEAILQAADNYQADLILMGGYGRHAVVDVVLGSDVDKVLRESRRPMLICR